MQVKYMLVEFLNFLRSLQLVKQKRWLCVQLPVVMGLIPKNLLGKLLVFHHRNLNAVKRKLKVNKKSPEDKNQFLLLFL